MNLSSIVISPNRQRREHDPAKHQELIEGIRTTGLLHAPVIRFEGSTPILVAGERRLRAIAEIWELGGKFSYNGVEVPEGDVPVTSLGDLSPLKAEEAEFEENVRRKDLTWQERAEAEARLLDLRTRQNPAATPGEVRDAVAAEASTTRPALRQSVILAANLHRPEVIKAKTASEAMKALMRGEATRQNAEKAAILGKDFLGGKHRLYNWDCVEWVKQQPAGEFDVICTDPPYGMGADEFGDSGGGAAGAHFYDDSYESWLKLLAPLPGLLFSLAKPDAHAYIFCDFDRFHELKSHMADAGWKVFRTPLLWFKPSAFRAPWPEQGPQRKYECILYAVKGNLKCTQLKGDVITCPPDENLGHQAQKPVSLYQDLLSRSVRPGMKVLDPFCGTGPVFPACHALSAIATGVEMDSAAFAIAAGRVAKLKEMGDA